MSKEAEHFVDALLVKLEGAFSPATLKSNRSNFLHYARWAESNALPLFPIQPAHLASYIEAMQSGYRSATIHSRITSLRAICFYGKLDDPTKSAEVKLALRRMYRTLGRHQKQAYPLTRDILEQLLNRCNASPMGRRNELLLRIGYETMRRSAEICSFRFDDLIKLPDGRHALLLRFSKTDQEGEGRIISISDLLARRIDRWSRRLALKQGPILRAISKDKRELGPLKSGAINPILCDLQHRAKLTHLPKLTGHSFRVGAALDMLRSGVPLEKIMLRGGWRKRSTALRYLKEWVDDVNPASLEVQIALQHRTPLQRREK